MVSDRTSLSPFVASAVCSSTVLPTHEKGRPRGTVGKAPASEARGTGFEPPWLVQTVALGIATPYAGWKQRGGCHPSAWSGGHSITPGTGRSSLKRVSISHPFAVSAMKHSIFLSEYYPLASVNFISAVLSFSAAGLGCQLKR